MTVLPIEFGLSNKHVISSFRSFIFFVLFYLYLWLCVDLRLIAGCAVTTNFPVFFKGWIFLRNFLSYPGGPVGYAGAFLSQFFYIGWAGALAVTMQAWLMFVCVGYIFKALDFSALRWLRFVPPILLLIAYAQYTYHLVTTMAFLTALLFICLYLRTTLSLASNRRRLAVFMVLSVILYYVAGGAFLLFAVFCAMYELLLKRRFLSGLLYLLLAVAVPYVEGVLLFGVSIVDAFGDSLPFSWKILSFEDRRRLIIVVYVLYLFLPFTMLLLGLWQKVPSSKIQIRFRSYLADSKLRWVIESLLLFGITFAAIFLSHDDKRKTELEVAYFASHKMWPQVLAAARRHPNSFPTIHAVNRTLYHTGRLSHDMFSWPQHPDTLFLTAKGHEFAYWKQFDFYIEVGLMNMAENALAESLEIYGEHPLILKRLALIRMVNKTLFHADWANCYLARLQSDPDLSTDKEIQRLRSLMLEKDYGFFTFEIEDVLSQLLEKNRQNRMAFEYLMAWYMLTKQLDKFIQNLERLDDFDFPTIPRTYEETMLVYVQSTRKPVDMRGRQLSPESRRRFKSFSQVLSRYGGNLQAASDELAGDYANSYFFYYVYARSGREK
jgi:hypothetical protein